MKKLFFSFFKKIAKTLKGKDLNRFLFIRYSLNFALKYFKPAYILVDGNKIYLDEYDSLRLSILGKYEPFMFDTFKKRIKPGNIVLDIGGHIGYYSVAASKSVGDKGKVYVFEPDKKNYSLLEKNIKINGCKNVVLINKAVSNFAKKTKFYLSSSNQAHHSLVENGGDKKVIVDTVKLDDFLIKELGRIEVVKMDIEGGEFEAVEGMSKLIKRSKRFSLFSEFSPLALKRSGHSPVEYLKLLEDLELKLFVIDEAGRKLEKIKFDKLLHLYPSNRDWHVNILAEKE